MQGKARNAQLINHMATHKSSSQPSGTSIVNGLPPLVHTKQHSSLNAFESVGDLLWYHYGIVVKIKDYLSWNFKNVISLSLV
jgi:hypothetical protein